MYEFLHLNWSMWIAYELFKSERVPRLNIIYGFKNSLRLIRYSGAIYSLHLFVLLTPASTCFLSLTAPKTEIISNFLLQATNKLE